MAGTNGKGSITACLSTLLTASGVPCGSFTSPHLIDRWDCVSINNRIVREPVFFGAEKLIRQCNESLRVGASEFELLTATAFEVFKQERVDIGIVEVGLGGRLDATNVLQSENVLVSVISKIGLDHQSFLGSTLEEITAEKAGIMKPGIPCIVDGSNPKEVIGACEKHARNTGSSIILARPETLIQRYPNLSKVFNNLRVEPHQQSNISCALTALEEIRQKIPQELDLTSLFEHIRAVPKAGRQELIDLSQLIDRRAPVLLDGAHNPQSAEVLASYVDNRQRYWKKPVTWVLAISEGKDLQELLANLLRQGDNVAAVEFGPVSGMPWVRSVKSLDLASLALSIVADGCVQSFGFDIFAGLHWANYVSRDGPLVVAGSLYLVSDVLRILRSSQ